MFYCTGIYYQTLILLICCINIYMCVYNRSFIVANISEKKITNTNVFVKSCTFYTTCTFFLLCSFLRGYM